MNRKIIIGLALVAPLVVQANLIADRDVDQKTLSSEFAYTGPADGGTISRFEEDLIWNGCLQLDAKMPGAAVLIGGSSAQRGFEVESEGILAFSFEATGSGSSAAVSFLVWLENGSTTEIAASPARAKLTKAWLACRGQVKLPKNAVRAALKLTLDAPGWARFDKFVIDPKNSCAAWPRRAAVVPREGSVRLTDFRSVLADAPARHPSEAEISFTDNALEIVFTAFDPGFKTPCSKDGVREIWFDDLVEIFLNRADGSERRHFAVSMGGGRWMAGDPDYASWSARVTADEKSWRAVVTLPWKTLGHAARPAAGEAIHFNLCRQRINGSELDPKTEKGTHNGYHLWFEASSWSFNRHDYLALARRGILFSETSRPHFDRAVAAFLEDETRTAAAALPQDDPTALVRGLERLAVQDRNTHLAKEPFTLAQVRPDADFTIPFLPDELLEPAKPLTLAAAGNERAFLPLALANMTDGFEEYRLSLTCGWCRPTEADEVPDVKAGLETKEGVRFPIEKVTFRRGVKYRDSEAEGHGYRFDMLPEMNEIRSLPVPPKEAGLAWLEFDMTDVKPGLYRGILTVTPLSSGRFEKSTRTGLDYTIVDGSKEYPVEIEVRPFALPKPSAFGVFTYGRAPSEGTIDYVNRIHGVMTMQTPWNFEADFDAAGNLTKRRPRPWTVAQLKRGLRANTLPCAPKMTVCYAVYDHFRSYICPKTIARGSEAFWNAYRQWLQYLDDMIVSNGYTRSDYNVELVDEPSPSRGMPVDELLRAAQETKKAVPEMRIYVTSGFESYGEKLRPYVDGWIFYRGNAAHYAIAREWAKEGKQVTFYDCNVSMGVSPFSYFRRLPWISENAGAKFASIFQFLHQPAAESFRRSPFGDIAYYTDGKIVPSIRGENLHLGVEDMRYMKLLESLATDDSPLSQEARALMNRYRHEIVILHPQKASQADAFRSAASKLILSLTQPSR